MDWLDNLANFGAGLGDTISLGGTAGVRRMLGTNGGIDPSSSAFGAGQFGGQLWWGAFAGALTGGAATSLGASARVTTAAAAIAGARPASSLDRRPRSRMAEKPGSIPWAWLVPELWPASPRVSDSNQVAWASTFQSQLTWRD